MEAFEKKNFWEQRKMALFELNKYYREYRKYEMMQDLPVEGISLRKKIYFLIRFILFLDKLFSRRTVKIIGDQHILNDRPKMYLCTHIGRYDIESALSSIGESAWFIMGNPGKTYIDLNGLILRLNGVSWFDMLKLDAHTVNVRQTKILSQGGNELSFPEQAWHLDPVYPVGDINPAPIRRAIKTNADIVPVAIEQYRGQFLKRYYVNIGENMNIQGANVEDAAGIAREVRQKMMDLKWRIWEKKGQTKRALLDKDWLFAYADFINSIMYDTENGYTIEEIENTQYKPKTDLSPRTILRREMDKGMVKHLLKKCN